MSIIYTIPVTEIIKNRFSCRSYVERPIKEETRRVLSEYSIAPKKGPFGNQPRFKLVAASDQDREALNKLGTYGFIKGATGFLIGATIEADRHLEDFGYLLECIILIATDLGLGTCWLGGTFTKGGFASKIELKNGEWVPAVASVGYAANKARRVEMLIRRGARADRRLPWDSLFFINMLGVPLPRQAAGDYALPLEMVRLSPSASNQQPWRIVKDGKNWHFFLRRTPGYQENILVKLFTVADMQRLDMGIAMCHFDLSSRELGLEGQWEIVEPGIETQDELTEYTASWIGW